VAKARTVRRDGIWFQGFRYIDITLAAYVGEHVILRYDPRDMAEIRVFYQDRFLCRAICQELAGATVPLREILRARNRRRRELRQTIEARTQVVEALVAAHRGHDSAGLQALPAAVAPSSPPSTARDTTPRLKRYYND
jgi:putative transposase